MIDIKFTTKTIKATKVRMRRMLMTNVY